MVRSSPFLAVQGTSPLSLCRPLTARHDEPELYDPPQGLVEAMDVAMMLGQPIVLTGAPGTGKTQAAKWLAHVLDAGELLRFDVKSTTLGGDLLYAFDDVARFRDAAAARSDEPRVKPLVRYLRFAALGYGIVRAAGPDSVLWTVNGEKLQGAEAIARNRRLLADVFGPEWMPSGDRVCVADLLPDDRAFREPDHGREVRVVLIDELDKAPRDTPNDLLVEVENMTFLIAELGLRVRTDRTVRPIVVITSNAEKPLPEAFLRRCAFFDLPRVDRVKLEQILKRSLPGEDTETFAWEVAEVAELLHDSPDAIRRKPGTAEMLAWAEVLVRRGAARGLLAWAKDHEQTLRNSLVALLKHADDQKAGAMIIEGWVRGPRTQRRSA